MDMATPPNMVDFLMLTVLLLMIPVLTRHYLKGRRSSERWIPLVTVLGMLWVIFGLVSEDLLEATIGFGRMDSWFHTGAGMALMNGTEGADFWRESITGNKAYQVWLSWIFSVGAHVAGARALNSFVALWGGLALAGRLRYFFDERLKSTILLAVIFLPSTVFWTSQNMKEGLMYWGVCLMASSAMNPGKRFSLLSPALIAGVIVTGFLRPHICLAWLIPICSVSLFTRGQRVYALIVLAVLPIVFFKMQDLAKHDLSSMDSAFAYLESRGQLLRGGGSAQTGISIPVISGLIAIFLRPFPWESGSILAAVCCAEIWTLTFTMIKSWSSLNPFQRRVAFKTPAVRIAVFAIGISSVLFSYLPNDGLLARQRVQVLPAVVILAIVPVGVRGLLRGRGGNARRSMPPPPACATPRPVAAAQHPSRRESVRSALYRQGDLHRS
jgi:hypothetical protein